MQLSEKYAHSLFQYKIIIKKIVRNVLDTGRGQYTYTVKWRIKHQNNNNNHILRIKQKKRKRCSAFS